PATCGAGYNSLRFDDEVTRNCLYRNFYDPYAREWQHGNSRWDIIDMLRLVRALRPETLEWPQSTEGLPSFRLEDLSRANGVEHSGAHDALADVYATIAVARLIRNRIPKLYAYVYERRHKNRAGELLDLHEPRPVLHVSGRYPASEGCIAVVAALARHPVNNNGIIVYNLAKDPRVLLDGSVEEIQKFLFTSKPDLADDEERVALKTVHLNKCPVVVPMQTLRAQDADRLRIDVKGCLENWAQIQKSRQLPGKLAAIFSASPNTPVDDPDLMIYRGGFFNDSDRAWISQIRNTKPEALTSFHRQFDDPRIAEMLFRYRARNFPESLSDAETERWNEYRIDRIANPIHKGALNLSAYRAEIEALRAVSDGDRHADAILAELEEWAEWLVH
ncbi:MAG: exodeoxyribonuclease I, partial [Methylococcales bacterium]